VITSAILPASAALLQILLTIDMVLFTTHIAMWFNVISRNGDFIERGKQANQGCTEPAG
jgi:hypothetical protein